jgi:hypothetical protein
LIVTLLGIALTAWLLPAITRQWDDRQKAHELKATLAADLASATARSLVEARAAARALVPGTAPQGLAATRRLNDMWLLDRLKIDAKLGAYFSPGAFTASWNDYDSAMRAAFVVALAHFQLLNGTKTIARDLEISDRQLKRDLDEMRCHNCLDLEYGFNDITDAVLAKEYTLVADISRAHVVGYSTTRRDLINDIFP